MPNPESVLHIHNVNGDVVQPVDPVGDVLYSYENDAFGVEIAPTDAAVDKNPFRYDGES